MLNAKTMRSTLLTLILLAVSLQPAAAQFGESESDFESDTWHYQFSFYFWGVQQSGDITVGDKTIPADKLFDNLFDSFYQNFSGRILANKKNYLILFDGRYIAADAAAGNLKIILIDFWGGYKLTKWFAAIAGGRYFYNRVKARFREEGNIMEREGTKSWVDPIVGGHVSFPVSRWIALSATADVGGFGLGSKFAWDLGGSVSFLFSNFSIAAGYRILSSDYKSGSGDNYFRYNVVTQGPGIGLTFHY